MPAASKFPGAQEWVPADGDSTDLATMATAVQRCRGCDLYEDATQAVFGEGPATAKVVLVGEQPGDAEDTEGHPFVGPAGRLLDRALADAGIDRAEVYITNAVKHFRFKRQGKRRLHQKPDVSHIVACAPWLQAELAAIRPEVVVVLGATAARSLLGASFRVTKQRGQPVDLMDGTTAVATIHPSAVLRSDDREAAYDSLVADLREVPKHLATS